MSGLSGYSHTLGKRAGAMGRRRSSAVRYEVVLLKTRLRVGGAVAQQMAHREPPIQALGAVDAVLQRSAVDLAACVQHASTVVTPVVRRREEGGVDVNVPALVVVGPLLHRAEPPVGTGPLHPASAVSRKQHDGASYVGSIRNIRKLHINNLE